MEETNKVSETNDHCITWPLHSTCCCWSLMLYNTSCRGVCHTLNTATLHQHPPLPQSESMSRITNSHLPPLTPQGIRMNETRQDKLSVSGTAQWWQTPARQTVCWQFLQNVLYAIIRTAKTFRNGQAKHHYIFLGGKKNNWGLVSFPTEGSGISMTIRILMKSQAWRRVSLICQNAPHTQLPNVTEAQGEIKW